MNIYRYREVNVILLENRWYLKSSKQHVYVGEKGFHSLVKLGMIDNYAAAWVELL